ncbi:MAG TPA: flagellar filament outer layer protein FlaA [Magnetospirillaceae bacterium]|nr:flagellar filament outer layer protein FlaA [Magnetospirillaceae bacterium]
MRRQSLIAAVAFLLVGAVGAFADEAVLIDFSLLRADIIADPAQQGRFTQNRATMIDFSATAGASFTEEQRRRMRTSLAVSNWNVELASSSRSLVTVSNSFTREAIVSQQARQFAGQSVLGIRVNFPLEPFNSWARVSPPFEIPSFEPRADISDDGVIAPRAPAQTDDPVNRRLSRFEGTYNAQTQIQTALGVVKNVGVIRSLGVTVRGLNFPHGLSLILEDQYGNENLIFMGYLNFDGWRELRWDNPQYIQDVRNRELRLRPLYPKTSPLVKLGGFLITRDAAHEGGDFVTYIRDVKLIYDRAILDPVTDIDDEAVWGIIGEREAERKLHEGRRFGDSQILMYTERLRQADRTEFTPSR